MSEPTSPLSSTTEYYRPVEVYVVRRPRDRYWIHVLLLLLSFFTMLVVGARMQFNFLHNLPAFSLNDDSLSLFPLGWALSQPSRSLLGIPFAATLMLILLAHEMGHYFYCRYYGVSATLPFFIPAPTLIGTLGAFIRIRGPIRSRAQLFDIGIAGPIAGFVVAVVVLGVALGLSRPMPAGMAPPDLEIGYPLIFFLMHRLLAAAGVTHGIATLPFDRVFLHPMAIAAWVGMLATALNLLPGGQLDGGHIVFALSPRAHKGVSRVTIFALLVMAYYLWNGWLVWAILLRLTGMRHPMISDWPRMGRGRQWLGVLALAMLVLTLTPRPIAHQTLAEFISALADYIRQLIPHWFSHR